MEAPRAITEHTNGTGGAAALVAGTRLPAEAPLPAEIERVLIIGDMSTLSVENRVIYYTRTCESLGLNPLTRPFDYILLDGPGGTKRLTLYAKRDCTDQLRTLRNVSVKIVGREVVGDIYVVTARATLPDGRVDESTGAVWLRRYKTKWDDAKKKSVRVYELGEPVAIPLVGEDLANAYMKAETKAKRRVTLSICGLGFLDESEVSSVSDAEIVSAEQAHDPAYAPIRRDEMDQRTEHEEPATPVEKVIERQRQATAAAQQKPSDLGRLSNPWLHRFEVEAEAYQGKYPYELGEKFMRDALANPKAKKRLSPRDVTHFEACIASCEDGTCNKLIPQAMVFVAKQNAVKSPPLDQDDVPEWASTNSSNR